MQARQEMKNSRINNPVRYRVWLTKWGDRERNGANSVPLTAMEPAEEGVMSMAEAARYVAAFNRAAEALGRKTRAVAVPVAVRYEGDPRPGQRLGAVSGR